MGGVTCVHPSVCPEHRLLAERVRVLEEALALNKMAALSAAEKERNGSKLPAAQEGREGDVIEKLREWIEVNKEWTHRLGFAVASARLKTFLDDLQEQSTEGDGTSPGEET